MADVNDLVVAALIDDDDDEESKAITKRMLEEAGSIEDEDEEIEDDDQDEDDPDEDKEVIPATSGDSKKEDDDDDSDKKVPPEAIDADADQGKDIKAEDEEHLSRKEKREQKRREFLERISTPPEDTGAARKELLNPDYKPLELTPDTELDVDELKNDRQQYGETRFLTGVQAQKALAEEEKFWQGIEYQNKLLLTDSKYSFLNEDDTENFDEPKAAKINNLYMKVIGYKEELIKGKDGIVLADDKGVPYKRITTTRKDLPYDEFVRDYMENVEEFVADNEAETTKNLVKQHAHQGVRPGGSSKRGLGKLKEGDISKMTDEEFEANEAEIDRQIMAELGA